MILQMGKIVAFLKLIGLWEYDLAEFLINTVWQVQFEKHSLSSLSTIYTLV